MESVTIDVVAGENQGECVGIQDQANGEGGKSLSFITLA